MDNLSIKQVKAIALLCEGKRANTVAAELNLTFETLRRWSLEPSYKAALSQARREVWHDAVSEAGTRVMNALATLQNIFLDEEASDSARVSAARAFIELTKPPIELLDRDGAPQSDRAQVVVWLPDNGRNDYDGDIISRSRLTEED